MYEGTLYGHWQAIVTLQQMLVLCNNPDGIVDMTPQAISARTSIPLEIIMKGIEVLSAPDPYSRTPGEDGVRIALLELTRPWGWRIVNYAKYQEMRNAAQKRDADRERIAAKRAAEKDNIIKPVAECREMSQESQSVANVAPLSISTSTSTRSKALRSQTSAAFVEFWQAYPNRKAKKDAIKAWSTVKLDDVATIMQAVEKHKTSDQWQRGFIPYAATWLRGRRWEDETTGNVNGVDLGVCMWNRDGARSTTQPRCVANGVEEVRGLIYCEQHKHLHHEQTR